MTVPHPRLSLLALAALALAPAARGQTFTWRFDYNVARKESADKGRPMLIDFGTENCMWCQRLDATTFRDPRVAALLQDRFVPLKVDAGQHPQLVQLLRIHTYPTLIIAAADGKILTVIDGYVDGPKLLEQLHKALPPGAAQDWMARDYQDAGKAIALGDTARAVALLRTILEDDRGLPVQRNAREALAELEKQADGRLAHARKMEDLGQALEAIDTLTELMRKYAGTAAANEAKSVLTALAARPEIRGQQRGRRAKELLALARDDFRTQQFYGCLEKCDLLTATYADLPECAEASQLAAEIRGNPEWLAKACSGLTERLSTMYLTLAESWLKKGKVDEAMACYEKVQQQFPGTQFAQAAQVKLAQLQGRPGQQTDFKK